MLTAAPATSSIPTLPRSTLGSASLDAILDNASIEAMLPIDGTDTDDTAAATVATAFNTGDAGIGAGVVKKGRKS